MTPEPQFQDKFIAFVDILGFKSKVEAVEKGKGLRLSDLLEYCSKLAQPAHTRDISDHGPMICPESRYKCRDLDYEVTQISDCAVISVEVSPAGVINLLHHVSASVLGLLKNGTMVRGYVSRGNIFHRDNQFMGTGYQDALRKEREVKAFRLPLDGTSTPFVEINPVVVKYIKTETDQCVREIFNRLSREDENGITVIYPFQRLSNLVGEDIMDAKNCKESLDVVRGWIKQFIAKLDSQSPHSDSEANQKAQYYRRLLNEQLEACNTIERRFGAVIPSDT